jgi:hypothetical protein
MTGRTSEEELGQAQAFELNPAILVPAMLA